jgi:predicted N-acyltransferase
VELSGGFDSVFAGWSNQHRRSARKATREGVVVRQADGRADWEAYFEAYRASLDRWGEDASEPYRWEMFSRMSDHPRDLVRLWLALVDGEVAAGAVCGYAKRHVVYWHGAAHARFFKKRPVHKLFHSVIADACERGYRWFDFNPSGGLEGVREFKRGFGTVELPCPTIVTESGMSRVMRRLGGKRP